MNPSKSDDYTEERAQIVAHVALGEAFRVLQPFPSAPPLGGDDGMELDSVWAESHDGGGCMDHIEVTTYSESQALPVALEPDLFGT